MNKIIISELKERFLNWKEKRTLQNINNFINALSNIEKNSSIILKSIIKEEREKQKLSLSELAQRSGHAVSTLLAIEDDKTSNPSCQTIADICVALGLSLNKLKQRMLKYLYKY